MRERRSRATHSRRDTVSWSMGLLFALGAGAGCGSGGDAATEIRICESVRAQLSRLEVVVSRPEGFSSTGDHSDVELREVDGEPPLEWVWQVSPQDDGSYPAVIEFRLGDQLGSEELWVVAQLEAGPELVSDHYPAGEQQSLDICLDLCGDTACDDPPSQCHVSPGRCEAGSCRFAWRENGDDCDDDDSCTDADHCADGVCVGTAAVCESVPPDYCFSNTTLRVFSGADGTCSDGSCTYPHEDTECCACDGAACVTTPWTQSSTASLAADLHAAVDSKGRVHVAFYEYNALSYAVIDSGLLFEIDPAVQGTGVGLFSDIAVDASDGIHVAYYDQQSLDLAYMYRPAGGVSWESSVLDSLGNVGASPAIAIAADGALHVAYYDVTNEQLKHFFTIASGGSEVELIDTDGNVGLSSSVAIDSLGDLHVSYYDASTQSLRYAHKPASGSWTSSILDDSTGEVGRYSSIAIDDLGVLHALYVNASSANLNYATSVDGVIWETSTVDTNNVNSSTASLAMQVDQDGVHIAYLADGKLRFGLLPPNSLWQFSKPATYAGSLAGGGVALTLGSQGVHIVHRDDQGQLAAAHALCP